MRHIFISPHLDDAVLSAGDLIIALKERKKKVLVITVFTKFGKGPLSWDSRKYLKKSFGISDLKSFAQQRRDEDKLAMKKLGVDYLHLGFIDGGFRVKQNTSLLINLLSKVGIGPKFIYPFHRKCSLFSGKVKQADTSLFKQIYKKLRELIKDDDILYCPLAIGNHVDHLIIKKIISQFPNRKYYWVDQPYVVSRAGLRQLEGFQNKFKKAFTVEKSTKKQDILRCYSSQIKCLFPNGINLKKESFWERKKIKIGLVTSRGGHLLQLFSLKDWWKKYDRFWITGRGEDSNYLLRSEKVYYGHFPESRNLVNAIRNFFLGFKILKKERPNLLVSFGAGIAPPIFLAGKILGCKLLFIDSYTFMIYPSLSAKLVTPIVDKLLVQHRGIKKIIKKAEFWGSII